MFFEENLDVRMLSGRGIFFRSKGFRGRVGQRILGVREKWGPQGKEGTSAPCRDCRSSVSHQRISQGLGASSRRESRKMIEVSGRCEKKRNAILIQEDERVSKDVRMDGTALQDSPGLIHGRMKTSGTGCESGEKEEHKITLQR